MALIHPPEFLHRQSDPAMNNNIETISQEFDSKSESKRNDSSSIIHDDETTTDWTPEIPFRNVCT